MIEKLKENKHYVISTVVVILIIIGASFIPKLNKPDLSERPIDIDLTSDIISQDPRETAANFIAAAGTIGDVKKEATPEHLLSGYARKMNNERRLKSYRTVRDAIITGSPLKDDNVIENHIRVYSEGLRVPVFFEVNSDSFKVGKVYNERDIKVSSPDGSYELNGASVDLTFISRRIEFTRPNDPSWDGNFTQIENAEEISLTVDLVEVDGKWLIYDIENVDELANSRLSTWRGVGKEKIDESNYINKGIIETEFDGGN